MSPSETTYIWLALLGYGFKCFLIVLRPDLQFYRRLSDFDMALAGYWVFAMFREARTNSKLGECWMWGGAFLVLLSKALVEFAVGVTLFVSDLREGVENAALAYLLGVVAGLAV